MGHGVMGITKGLDNNSATAYIYSASHFIFGSWGGVLDLPYSHVHHLVFFGLGGRGFLFLCFIRLMIPHFANCMSVEAEQLRYSRAALQRMG
jgi:hypothetical protein